MLAASGCKNGLDRADGTLVSFDGWCWRGCRRGWLFLIPVTTGRFRSWSRIGFENIPVTVVTVATHLLGGGKELCDMSTGSGGLACRRAGCVVGTTHDDVVGRKT